MPPSFKLFFFFVGADWWNHKLEALPSGFIAAVKTQQPASRKLLRLSTNIKLHETKPELLGLKLNRRRNTTEQKNIVMLYFTPLGVWMLYNQREGLWFFRGMNLMVWINEFPRRCMFLPPFTLLIKEVNERKESDGLSVIRRVASLDVLILDFWLQINLFRSFLDAILTFAQLISGDKQLVVIRWWTWVCSDGSDQWRAQTFGRAGAKRRALKHAFWLPRGHFSECFGS